MSHANARPSDALRNTLRAARQTLGRDHAGLVFFRILAGAAARFYAEGQPARFPPPRASLAALYPGIDGVALDLRRGPARDGEISATELLALCQLAAFLRPATVFEFGTFLGSTTLHLARAAPAAAVYTLDLPVGAGQIVPIDAVEAHMPATAAMSGRAFHGTDAADRITEIAQDSIAFYPEPYRGAMEMIFVDAAHDYDHARTDTANALAMLAPGGVILWHDYPRAEGVVRAIADVTPVARARGYEIIELEHTALVLLRSRRPESEAG